MRDNGLKPRGLCVPHPRRMAGWAVPMLVVWLCLAGMPGASQAEALRPTSAAYETALVAKLEKRCDLVLRDTSLPDALGLISELWQINLVAGPDVSGQVSGVYKDAPLHEVLDSILLANGYGYLPVGQSFVVLPLDELGDVNPLFETAAIPVRGADPQELVAATKLLTSPRGQVEAIPSARSLLVADFPERVAMIRSFVDNLHESAPHATAGNVDGGAVELDTLKPQFVAAGQLKEALNSVLSPDGKVAIIDKENRVVIVDYPHRVHLARRMMDKVDVPRPQVRITAYIYDLSVEDIYQFGINWGHAVQGNRRDADGNPKTFWAIDAVTRIPFDAGTTSGVMTFFNMSRNFDLNAVVNFLDQAVDSRLLADPNVTVMDNEEATFDVVTEIPYQQLTETGQGGQIGTTSFRDAGVKLKVKPRVAADDTIELVVNPEFSRLTGFTPEDDQPIIDTRKATTTVRVSNGQTLVIGGLRTRTDLNDYNGIPYLQDLPIIGYLFRGHGNTVRESELVVFIRPEIVEVNEPLNYRESMALDVGDGCLHQVPLPEPCQAPCCEHGFVDDGSPEPTEPEPVNTPTARRESRVRLGQRPLGEILTTAPSRPPIQRLPAVDSSWSSAELAGNGHAPHSEVDGRSEPLPQGPAVKTASPLRWFDRLFQR